MSKDDPVFAPGLSEAESQPHDVPATTRVYRAGSRAQSPAPDKDDEKPAPQDLSHVVPSLEDIPQATFSGRPVDSLSQADRESLGKLERERHGAEKEPRDNANTVGSGDEGLVTRTLPDNAPVWKAYLQQAKAHDDEFVKVQNSDLDSILIFAGLFSAILSAFLIEIRKGLQEDLQSTTNDLLRALLMQNATIAATTVPFQPSSSSIWVNALWFLSLTLSLVGALGTIMAKGWITQYTASTTSGVAADDVCLHHRRFNGITQWHLKTAVDCLPVFIHAAFFFFFAGLVILLGEDDLRIQDTVLALVGVTILIYSASTMLPLLYPDCPFRTPVSGLIAKFLSIRAAFTYFFPTISRGPAPDTLKASALAWLLLNSTHKTDLLMCVEAIASLPANPEVQWGLSEGNAAGVLAEGLSEYIRRLRTQDPDSVLRQRVETCLYAILRLVQTGPPGGPTGRVLASLVQFGGPLAQWNDLGPGIAEIALCVKARIALLYLDWTNFKDIFETEVPIMFQVTSQPHVKQMLGEILIIHSSSEVLQWLQSDSLNTRSHAAYPLSADWRNKVKQQVKLTNVGSIRALIQSLHTDDNDKKLKVLDYLAECVKSDVWREQLELEGIQMILGIGEESKADGKVRDGEVRDTDRDVKERSRNLVASLVKYEHIRATIFHSALLDTVVKDFINNGPTLDAMLMLSEHVDFREHILNSGALATIANLLKDRAWLNQSTTRDAISKLLQHDSIREKLFNSNTLAIIISSLHKKGNYVQIGALEAISSLAQIDDLGEQFLNAEVLGTIVTFLDGGDWFIQLNALTAISELSQNDIIRAQLLSSGAIISVMNCLNASVIVQGAALRVVSKLSQYDNIRPQVLTPDCIARIVTWLEEDRYHRLDVLEVIPMISQHYEIRTQLFKPEVLALIITYLKEDDISVGVAALKSIAVLSKYDDIRVQIINSNGYATIITCLKDNDSIGRGAVEVVTELAKYDDIRRNILDSETITLLRYLKDSRSINILAAILELLEYVDVRSHMITSGGLALVVNSLTERPWDIQEAALKTVLKFSKYDDIRALVISSDVLDLILNWLKDSNAKVRRAALEAITELLKYSDTREQLFISDTLVTVIAYLRDSDSDVRAAASGTIAEICQYDDVKTRMIELGGLATIIEWLKDSDPNVRSTILEAVTNISRHTQFSIEPFHLHLMPLLPGILSDPSAHSQITGASILSILGHHDDIRATAITPNIMVPLLRMLSSRDSDSCIAATEAFLALGFFDKID